VEVSTVIAAGAGLIAIVALVAVLVLWSSVRRLRAAQQILLPEGATASLTDRQATLQRAMAQLERGLADLEGLVEHQAATTEASLRTALRFQGLVRYDAYRDMGGRQSWSIALIDESQTGSVITCLHARDHARVYLKELVQGASEQRLSPEEERAVALALGRPPVPRRTPEREREPYDPDDSADRFQATHEMPAARDPDGSAA
jgi:hypothetical protein